MQDYLTVASLNAYITEVLDNDEILQNFWLKGEISGFRLYQQSGHSYFTLKDEQATVSCVMFKSKGQYLNFKPEDGMEVLMRGSVSVFVKQGKYQVYVEEMQPYGIGELFLYLEKLKKRLAAQGYFDQAIKKPIPRIVGRVGVVTSQDGAALRDILRVLKQRHPGVKVLIAHSSVQGADAPQELARGIQTLNEYSEVDVIIIGRGGGSLEDLMAFNSEEVVQAIYNSSIPIISAVGHEVDYSLSDLAADLRAATPTQAAQLAVPELALLEKEFEAIGQRLQRSMQRNITMRAERLDRSMMKKVWTEPRLLLLSQEEKLMEKSRRLHYAVQDKIKEDGHRLALAAGGLDNLSPLRVICRGYAVLSKDKSVVRDVDTVQIGEELSAQIANGSLQVVIKGKEKIERWQN